jgi:CRP-like cAMP-binding protein
MSLLESIRSHALLGLLNPSDLLLWASLRRVSEFSAGDTIFQAGTKANWVYLVEEGSVRVVRKGASGTHFSLGSYVSGDLFGEFALLRPYAHVSTCRAVNEVVVSQFPIEPLRELLGKIPELQGKLKSVMRMHAMTCFLRNRSFLGFMSAPSSLRWLHQLEELTVPEGTTLQTTGVSDQSWMFLKEGEVVALTNDGRRQTLVPGEGWGVKNLLGMSCEQPNLVATKSATCFSLSRVAFEGQSRTPVDDNSLSLLASKAGNVGDWIWVGQEQSSDCGFAVLAMIARYFKKTISMPMLRQLGQVCEEGVSVGEITRVASKIGLTTQAVRIVPEQFSHLKLPVIVHLRNGHYVVLFDIQSCQFVVGDPEVGIVHWSASRFFEIASGIVLIHGVK